MRDPRRRFGPGAGPSAELQLASTMHDVGKVAVPDAILLKPGKLTDAERVEMQRHAQVGHDMLASSDSQLFQLAAVIAVTHHERHDGRGYPNGLRGDAIPLPGRIAAVADVFDALTSDRVYKAAMPVEQAVAIIREGAGSQFCPRSGRGVRRVAGRDRGDLRHRRDARRSSHGRRLEVATVDGFCVPNRVPDSSRVSHPKLGHTPRLGFG